MMRYTIFLLLIHNLMIVNAHTKHISSPLNTKSPSHESQEQYQVSTEQPRSFLAQEEKKQTQFSHSVKGAPPTIQFQNKQPETQQDKREQFQTQQDYEQHLVSHDEEKQVQLRQDQKQKDKILVHEEQIQVENDHRKQEVIQDDDRKTEADEKTKQADQQKVDEPQSEKYHETSKNISEQVSASRQYYPTEFSLIHSVKGGSEFALIQSVKGGFSYPHFQKKQPHIQQDKNEQVQKQEDKVHNPEETVQVKDDYRNQVHHNDQNPKADQGTQQADHQQVHEPQSVQYHETSKNITEQLSANSQNSSSDGEKEPAQTQHISLQPVEIQQQVQVQQAQKQEDKIPDHKEQVQVKDDRSKEEIIKNNDQNPKEDEGAQHADQQQVDEPQSVQYHEISKNITEQLSANSQNSSSEGEKEQIQQQQVQLQQAQNQEDKIPVHEGKVQIKDDHRKEDAIQHDDRKPEADEQTKQADKQQVDKPQSEQYRRISTKEQRRITRQLHPSQVEELYLEKGVSSSPQFQKKQIEIQQDQKKQTQKDYKQFQIKHHKNVQVQLQQAQKQEDNTPDHREQSQVKDDYRKQEVIQQDDQKPKADEKAHQADHQPIKEVKSEQFHGTSTSTREQLPAARQFQPLPYHQTFQMIQPPSTFQSIRRQFGGGLGNDLVMMGLASLPVLGLLTMGSSGFINLFGRGAASSSSKKTSSKRNRRSLKQKALEVAEHTTKLFNIVEELERVFEIYDMYETECRMRVICEAHRNNNTLGAWGRSIVDLIRKQREMGLREIIPVSHFLFSSYAEAALTGERNMDCEKQYPGCPLEAAFYGHDQPSENEVDSAIIKTDDETDLSREMS